eukprot:CAMPEP_0198338832 /NCGR_PEP_ID=MMETSP1450-20131203/37482_1 /TAXON_ID=753684 ORGANISM="Madagascaria erythrocladiodes, Strain CCMP3234" /NCGR_SAMPLE_ID=MMETSP1450 /ASSEMBLY_ACC=CAM_ASM_001115 /LENGTH=268 /DNA_ID=CAMNT_0044043729 /DNA_START=95 /DNA_END=901 /DNA_ORIENTATION=-
MGKTSAKKAKAAKKRVVDPFSRKVWYNIKAPSYFRNRNVGFTLVNKTQGTKIASDALKGRVFEACLADLQMGEDQAYRKIKLRCDDVNGKDVLTNFHGMSFTTDKLRSLVRKWQTLIEATVDVKTSDNYLLRVFVIGFTKRRQNQVKKTTYAQSAQVRQIRKKMHDIVVREASTCELADFVGKLIPESINRLIEKECQGIYPMKDVHIRKVKLIKAPRFDPYKLMELHQDDGGAAEVGEKVADDAADAAAADADADAAAAQEEVVGDT